jgi:ribosome-associated toxin RatA of RatAB toxin-antitoxin module
MANVQKTVLVHYTAEQMFDLVTDVAEYPHFLPWCSGVDILQQNENAMEARLHIRFKGIRQHFTTCNRQQRPIRIDMQFTEGPFKKLTGAWCFTPLSHQACKVDFTLHYEFANSLLAKLVGPVFHHIANTFTDAFVKRAQVKYGSC